MSKSEYGKTISFSTVLVAGFFQELDSLSDQRSTWEESVYKTANEELYALLAKVYGVYETSFVNGDDKMKKALKETLLAKLSSLGMRTLTGTTVLGMLVRYVFKSDRKRNSRYLKAIEAAKSHGKTPENLSAWLRECGGIDEVVKCKGTKAEAERKAAAMCAEIAAITQEMHGRKDAPLGRVDLGDIRCKKAAVLIAHPSPEGLFNVLEVIDPCTESVLKALLKLKAAKRLEDKGVAAALNKEAAAFIKKAPVNDEQLLKAA
jgi:hypothetical protein